MNCTVITSHLDPAIADAHLQKACDAINNWLENVKLSLYASKTVLVIFSRRKIALPQLFLFINGIKIIPSRTVKYLGFLLDAQLKWTDHITQKCVAAKRALFAVYNCLRATWGVERRRPVFADSNLNRLKFELIQELIQKTSYLNHNRFRFKSV